MPSRSAVSLALAALAAAPLLLSACGGSGSDSPTTPPPPDCSETDTCPAVRVSLGGFEVALASTVSVGGAQAVSGHRDVVLTIANTGGSDLVLRGAAVQLSGTHATQFGVPVQPPATSLAPTEEASFTLRLDPSGVGTRTARVSIASNAPGSPFTFTVEGQGRDSIWLFRSAATHTGDLGGRAGADAICAADYEASFDAVGCGTVHAFLSVDGSDTIKNLGAPALHDVRTVTDVQVETSWANLWDRTPILASLASLGSEQWWSGSQGDGTPMQTCAGWTAPTGVGGTLGSTTTAAADSWLWSGAFLCQYEHHLLCVCW